MSERRERGGENQNAIQATLVEVDQPVKTNMLVRSKNMLGGAKEENESVCMCV